MEGVDSCFPFLRVPARAPKPRTKGFTIVSDRGLAIQEAKNLMETYADLIDYMKFTDHVSNIARNPRDWLKAKMEIYHSHQCKTFPGGIPFEVAAVQNQVRAYMESLKELGFDGVEISEDVIPPLPVDVRLSYIKMAHEIGLEAFTEVGKKDPTGPLDADEAIAAIQRDLDHGAKKTTIENSDIVLLMKTDAAPLKRIVDAIGIDHVVFEVGPHGWPEVGTWVIRTFGPDINLENLDSTQLATIDSMRRGMHRAVNYEFLSVRHGRID